MDGWILLQRKIVDNYLFKENRVYSKLEAWVDMLFMANFKDKTMTLNKHVVKVRRGCFLSSYRQLAKRWKWSHPKVSRFMNELLENNQIKMEKINKDLTVINILNYDKHQRISEKANYEDDAQDSVHKNDVIDNKIAVPINVPPTFHKTFQSTPEISNNYDVVRSTDVPINVPRAFQTFAPQTPEILDNYKLTSTKKTDRKNVNNKRIIYKLVTEKKENFTIENLRNEIMNYFSSKDLESEASKFIEFNENKLNENFNWKFYANVWIDNYYKKHPYHEETEITPPYLKPYSETIQNDVQKDEFLKKHKIDTIIHFNNCDWKIHSEGLENLKNSGFMPFNLFFEKYYNKQDKKNKNI